jgi:hypothetical protein
MGGIISAIGGLFKPKMPEIKKEVMPDPNAPAAKIKAREKIQARNKAGRDSTIYTGQAYSGVNLGGTA